MGRITECRGHCRPAHVPPGHEAAQQGQAAQRARLPAVTPSPVAPPARLGLKIAVEKAVGGTLEG